MAKLLLGEQMPDFSFCTPFTSDRRLSETAAAAPKTALLFLRYYGCTLCQYDIHLLAEHHSRITENGGRLLVVFQSDAQHLAGQLTEDSLPFELICDPDQELYRAFAIEPAGSMEQLADAAALEKLAKARELGLSHGEYEGNELQLPAVFVIDSDRRILFAHYGASAGDIPTPDQLAGLLS